VGLDYIGPYGIDAHWRRFFAVLLTVMALSHVWTIFLFFYAGRHFARYFKHNLVYSIVHTTAFACAVALFSTILDRHFFGRVLPSNRYIRPLLALVMMTLFGIVTWAVFADAMRNNLEPYMVKDQVILGPGSNAPSLHPRTGQPMRVMDYDAWLHEQFAELPPTPPKGEDLDENERKALRDVYESKLSAYKEHLAAYLPYVEPLRLDFRWGRLNPVAYVSFLLSWFFSEFLVAYVGSVLAMGYLYIRLWNLSRQARRSRATADASGAGAADNPFEREREYYFYLWNHYIIVFMLVVSWFPFRAASTYYQNAFLLKTNWVAEYEVYGILVLAAFVFLAVLLLLRYGKVLLGWLALLQVVFASVSAAVAYFNEVVRGFFYEILERILNSSFAFFMIINLVLFILAVTLSILGPHGTEEDQD
jgi:hypothetical protein